MDMAPKKPQKSRLHFLKPLQDAVIKSKETSVDTKALEGVTKEMTVATKQLEAAMVKSHKAYHKMFTAVPDPSKTPSPTSPVPIPYPTFSKLDKEAKGAVKTTQKIHKKLEKTYRKLDKVIDQQIKLLKPDVKSSNGDEAVTMKGLVTAKRLGKLHFTSWSADVKAEGKNVHRFSDLAHKNLY
ncbi:DUF4150 domain-containing protein [Sulfitobacter sp. F26204]|uniref:PAAR-like domain-containing protein n=1 Tax=Sulfitobacter sp. F26204 TaxID=2996014 RepID=UPI00225E2CFD|nr:PAAR-like domain-containing protein [Sulfitobacter sp. F26204]MCX7558882.1 DUF4150 domain-containing protein [Sulfitobacter sp. F26204]